MNIDLDQFYLPQTFTFSHMTTKLYSTYGLVNLEVIEWLLLNANSAIFQLYHGENKLVLNEMMMGSAFCRQTRWVDFL